MKSSPSGVADFPRRIGQATAIRTNLTGSSPEQRPCRNVVVMPETGHGYFRYATGADRIGGDDHLFNGSNSPAVVRWWNGAEAGIEPTIESREHRTPFFGCQAGVDTFKRKSIGFSQKIALPALARRCEIGVRVVEEAMMTHHLRITRAVSTSVLSAYLLASRSPPRY